jgi:hypothetical protein
MLVVADVHHFDEEQDPDPDQHQGERSDPDPHHFDEDRNTTITNLKKTTYLKY